MKKRKVIRVILPIVFATLLIAFAVFNYCNNEKFFDASLVNIITIGTALFVSFFLVQRKTDERKQKDILLDLFRKLQSVTESEKVYKFDGQSKEIITMRNRDINNKISILEKVDQKFIKKEDIDFIRKKFDEYSGFIGDHIEDIPYLSKSEKELRRPLELINNCITEMMIGMFE